MSDGEHKDVAAISRRAQAALHLVTRWRNVFASWQLGTRRADDGEYLAVRDHRELAILLRVEVNALTNLMIEKGVFSQVELTEALTREAEHLNASYAKRFDGMEATMQGIAMDPARAMATMQSLGFPP